MKIVVVGLNHRTAPLGMREKLAFPERSLGEALKKLLEHQHIREGVILSTCNRVEIYTVVDGFEEGKAALKDFLEDYHQMKFLEIEDKLYLYTGPEVVSHLFRVASSLDSLVVGEAQILGQVKAAYSRAHENSGTGKILNSLFQKSFRVAKEVRTNTDIAKSPTSVSSVAVELAGKIFGNLSGKKVLLLGAGEMSEITARCLSSSGVTSVLVSNRTFSRAEELAGKFQGRAVKFDKFIDEMVHADIIISSTNAPHYVIKKEDILNIMPLRRHRPIFFIDIAVPRDIEPEVNRIDNVYLYNMDDLKAVSEENLKLRQKEMERCLPIIERETAQFMNWLSSLESAPTIVALKRRAEEVCRKEVERSLLRLGKSSAAEREEISSLARRLVQELLHRPITCLKKQAGKRNGYLYAATVRDLFDLDEFEEGKEKPSEKG
ncbi:MAG: glutamyl-tRNA reductase [Nitrospirae bacterium]|nr:glutamyl-tRNA reductase [Nitrospirota bacterium]